MATRKAPTLITANGKTIYLNNKELLAEVIKSKKKGVMSNQLAMMLQMLCSRYAKKGNFVGYCVDEKTQALTKRGWVSYNTLTEDDFILSYDEIDGKLKWSEVFGVYRNSSYEGKMHWLTTEGMDALVTPGHKFVSHSRGIIPVEDIISREHIVLMGEPVADPDTQFTDAEVQVIGWAVTEGCYSKKSVRKHNISIYQKPGTKADIIRTALIRADVHFKEYLVKQGNLITFNCSGPFITKVHSKLAPNKVLSMDFILSLTQQQRMLLITTMVSGDGWIRPSGGLSYGQKDEAHLDAFLALCTIAGQTTGYSTEPYPFVAPNGTISECRQVNIYAKPKKRCKAEWINFHGGKQSPGGRRENKPNLPTEEYSGVVWCPQTEHGTFVARRGKYIYVTGNSYNEDMQAYAMMMLVRTWNAFNPEKSNNPFAFFTQCIKHSFIQYLNQEKRQRNIRDLLLVDQGMSPSFGFDDGVTRPETSDDEEDFDNIKTEANRLAAISAVESVNETDLTDPEVETEEKTT